MPRLAIIDHIVSAGGVERFLHGLVSGMLLLPEIAGWDITIVLARRTSGGSRVEWPKHIASPNLHVIYLPDNRFSFLSGSLPVVKRLWRMPGVTRVQRPLARLLGRHGTLGLGPHPRNPRLWIERFCRRQQFGVVYFSYPYLMECPRLPQPIVTTPHDFSYKRFATFGPETRSQIDRQTPEWFRQSKFLVVSSNFIASELQSFYPEFANKVRVVRLGIPSAPRMPRHEEVKAYRHRAGLPNRFLLTAGWIVPHKNQLVLFRALGQLKKQGIAISLVCVGPNSAQLQAEHTEQMGTYVREIVQEAATLGLDPGRDYLGLGYVSDFDLECLYRSAYALVVPTLYEAGSFPVIEAMDRQCPVICSQVPALMEQARLVGNNVWMFDPSSPESLAGTIIELLNNPEAIAEHTRKAKQLVARSYSWQKAAFGYLTVFQEALANRKDDSTGAEGR